METKTTAVRDVRSHKRVYRLLARWSDRERPLEAVNDTPRITVA